MINTITPTTADMGKAAAALRVLLAACERVQSEQPTRRFIAPSAAAEVHRLAGLLDMAGA